MKHITEVPVRFADLDAMGHVNNAIYLNYFEQARMGFFAAAIGTEWDWKRDGIVLARNEVDYMAPLLLQESVSIETSVEHVGTKSMTLSYTVFDSDKTYAKGRSVIVCFDYVQAKAVAVPEIWRDKFSKKSED